MKRLISFTTAILAAFLALLLLTSTVRSGPLTDRSGQSLVPAANSLAHALPGSGFSARPRDLQSTTEFSRTRIVTITVGTTTVPLTPSLNSRWQIDIVQQEFFTGPIQLPADAYAISVTLVNGAYGIDYSELTIFISNSQGLYYEYQTAQQALRFGKQILISQTYSYNRPLHHVATMIFTNPYQYLGTAGYAPTQTTATQLHWDQSFTETKLHQFEAAAWLWDPGIPDTRPDLEIATATLLRQLNHVYVAASIRNIGPMTASAPAYLNLYDRIAPSTQPTSPLDLANSWCSLAPVSWCGGGTPNPLPAIPPFQTVIFTAEYDLNAVNGQHDIYLFVDALGGSQGLNVESSETNNSKLAGSVIRWDFSVFLPVIKRQ